jgi:rfaE bifunctional protein kinase chain/domain
MKQDWQRLRAKLKGVRIGVLGDLMVDHYLLGEATRISPEAPVPVVEVREERHHLGGAGNVAVNLQALGCDSWLCGLAGEDATGKQLRRLMLSAGIQDLALVQSPDRRTTRKTRILAASQQLLRLDNEDLHPATARELELVREALARFMQTPPSAMILQDYDKGVFTVDMIEEVEKTCHLAAVPVLVDPKKEHFFDFKRAKVFKPNLKELRSALKQSVDGEEDLAIAMQTVARWGEHEWVVVTLGPDGLATWNEAEGFTHYPAQMRRVADVSGAGDTVIATLAAAIGAGLPVPRAAQLANLAGGLVCEELGVVPVNAEKLIAEADRLL